MQIKSSNGLFWLKIICFYFSKNKSIKLVERVHLCKNSVNDAVRKGACGQGFEGVLSSDDTDPLHGLRMLRGGEEWSCSECSHFLPSPQGGIDIIKGPGMNFLES